ncbi:MAG: glycosyltransferase family 2 protein [Clostridiales bacterium]|nr:glycosyltransferase family 2 protein [Clostridiales bacterium]
MNDTSGNSGILFSVIIPHYNSPVLLKKLLGTIPADGDIEVIVVDDRSDKNLEELDSAVSVLQERNGLFLRNEDGKKGAGTCRNLALEKAQGDWLIFADADDYFLDGAFSMIRNACRTDADADLLYFDPSSAYLDTGEPAKRHEQYSLLVNNYRKDPSRLNEVRLRYQFLPPWSKVFRRAVVTENSLSFEEVPVSNDVMFSVRFAHLAKKIAVYDKTFYCVTRASNTLTRTNNRDWLRIRVQVFVERYTFLKDHLSKEDFQFLGITGKHWLLTALLDKYDIGEVLYILRLYKKNHVKLFLPSNINIFMDIRGIVRMLAERLHERKHQ